MTTQGRAIFGASSDEEINRTWKEVEDRVVQMAGGDRSKIRQLRIENVLEYLDKAQSSDKKAAEKYGTVRNIFNRTLQCIQTVGGIVADGASYAFAPAGTCYNALTFVIQAWQGYEGIFESLASLLEKCTEFLDRLSYYAGSGSGMDSKLTKVACQHLYLFVEICDRSLKLKLKRHKFTAFVKQMFLNDDGVQDLLTAMQSLVDKERGLVSAQTWKSSNEAAMNSRDGLSLTRNMHNSLVEDKNQLKREKELQKWKLSIVKALEVEAKILDEDEPWEMTWKRHKSKIVDGSGEWLAQDARFKAWATTDGATTDGESSQILGLEGEDGAGKTLLAANVILHLRQMKMIEASGSRVVVAHNFVEAGSKSSINSDTAAAISRNLMCQLALGDEPFMKSVAAICEKSQYFKSPLDMWTQLLLQNEEITNINATFFIVLDGLDNNVDAFTQLLRIFSDSALIRRTRLLLTGNRAMFDVIERAGGLKVEKIGLRMANQRDVELYINRRMDEMEILKDTSKANVSNIREKILNDLPFSAKGDYYKISRVLDNISKTNDTEDINAHLRGVDDAWFDQIDADIERLNETCTPKEIAEINEIILWASMAPSWMTPLEMEGVLALKGDTSLVSIESKIKTKYTIFSTEYGFVTFKFPQVSEKIPLKNKESSGEASSSGSKGLQPAEMNILKHYLSVVCPPDLYAKAGFDDFFNLKMVRKRNFIYRDPENGHITVVIRSLTCLENERNEKSEHLRGYVNSHLLHHLKETDLSLADRPLKAEAGALLVKLFTEKFALDSLFDFHAQDMQREDVDYTNFEIPDIWNAWIFGDEGTNTVAKWFKDSAVIEKVKDSPLIKAFNSASANQHRVLFDTAAKLAAENLFQIDVTKRETFYAFVFLYSLLTKEDRKDTGEVNQVFNPTISMFQMVEDWSQELLDVADKGSVWEAKAAALLGYLPRDNIPSALVEERIRKAMELDSTNWRASYTLSKFTESAEEGIALLEGAINRLMDDTKWRNDKQHGRILADMILELGDRYWEDDGTRDKAMEVYAKILQIDQSYSIIKSFHWILIKYSSIGKWDAIAEFLEGLLEHSEDGKNMAGLFIGGGLTGEGRPFRRFLRRLATTGGRWDLVERVLEKAREIEHKDVFLFLYLLGLVLVQIEGREETGIAVWETVPARVGQEWQVIFITKYIVTAWINLVTAQGTTQAQAAVYDSKVESWFQMFGTLYNDQPESCVVFAEYFRLRGNETRAKNIMRNFARESLEMLYDDDVENDMVSFWGLGCIFSTMRDTANNLVAWEMVAQVRKTQYARYEERLEAWKQRQAVAEGGKPADDANLGTEAAQQRRGTSETDKNKSDDETSTVENKDEEPQEPAKYIAHCNGDCDGSFKSLSGFWICLTESGAIHFCDECYELLLGGKLDPFSCHKDHDHLHLERDDDKMDAVPAGSVLVGERIVTLDEWKEEIRTKYVDF
ncbi:hypothetical protein B0J13DRAFT_286660 [Dactylonectria estremocensis]|uniref:Fungal STAND N-terminal Goodbye domain-containing protein n=1 Tax=Dactylonectria estremocensis TaxID=1079267 RepID=A0A9P9F1E4_9HYPO|nr:hypothetical protein B0J13DRAFT_286660 [Dactylonectria estremocensis]